MKPHDLFLRAVEGASSRHRSSISVSAASAPRPYMHLVQLVVRSRNLTFDHTRQLSRASIRSVGTKTLAFSEPAHRQYKTPRFQLALFGAATFLNPDLYSIGGAPLVLRLSRGAVRLFDLDLRLEVGCLRLVIARQSQKSGGLLRRFDGLGGAAVFCGLSAKKRNGDGRL
jgi:hypothetical protein